MFTYRVHYRQISIETITVLTITIEPLRAAGEQDARAAPVFQLTIAPTVPPAEPPTALEQPRSTVGE